VGFAREVGTLLPPSQAAEMGQRVAEVLKACGAVTEQIVSAKHQLKGIKQSEGCWKFSVSVVSRMYAGVNALRAMGPPIVAYIGAVVALARRIGGQLDPRLAASMSQGVADVLKACGDVTQQIIDTKDKLSQIRASEGFWIFAVKTVDKLNDSVDALKQMQTPIVNFVGAIVSMAQEMGNKVKPSQAQKLVKVMTAVGTLVESTSKIINDLNTKIAPLTRGGFFSSSILSQLDTAKNEFQDYCPGIVAFVKEGIVDQVKGAFADMSGLKDAGKKLKLMSLILDATMPAVSIMSEKIAPLTDGGFFSASPLEKIKAA